MHLFSLETKSIFLQLPYIPLGIPVTHFVSPRVLLVTPVCKRLFNLFF